MIKKSGSPFGCVWFCIAVILVWGLLFGVTVGGKHHGIGCSCERGVMVE